jgi:predicted phage terminase large subunit-like protein
MTSVIAPCSIPQELFINSTADICFYGGQAGGGKTFSALMHHMKYMDDPLYRGLILRRTTPMLMKPGAIWDEAKSLYKDIDPGCKIKIKDLKIIMSSGAEIAFSHFERVDTKDNFQGSQISSVFFDELCQFEEEQFLYLLSRLRTKAKMKPCARAAMNPDPDSFVRKWVDWYLFPQSHPLFGRPDPSKQGVVRWFVRLDNQMIWANSKEELLEHHPESVPLSFQFISASVYDNPHIEPSYIAFLEGLGQIEKELLLYGNWEARAESAGFWKRQWCEELIEAPHRSEFTKIVRAYDLAGELKSSVNADPDFSVGVKMGRLKNGNYVILDVIRFRARFGDVISRIIKTAEQDGPEVDVLIPQDPNASAKAACKMMVQQVIEAGFYAKARPTNRSKIDRFRPFGAASENGYIKVVRNCCDCSELEIYNDNNFYYTELEKFNGGRAGHDDMCDATADAFMQLATRVNVPNFSSGLTSVNLSTTNPFTR